MKTFGEYVHYNLNRIFGQSESVKTETEHYIDGCTVIVCQEHLANKKKPHRSA